MNLLAKSGIGAGVLAFLSGPGSAPSEAASKELRFTATHSFDVVAPVEQVFVLFTPDGERRWEPDWSPMPVVPREIRAEKNAVFLTGGEADRVVWTIVDYVPAEHRIEYLVVDPGFQQRWITVHCEAPSPTKTSVTVSYEVTALSTRGSESIRRYDADFIRDWEAPVRQAALKAVAEAN
jgi:hypothetical protein